MIHKKGSENVNADALSRANHLNEPTAEENAENQIDKEVGEMKKAFASDLDRDPTEIAKERRRFIGYPPSVHSRSLETRHRIIKCNKLRKLRETDEVWKEAIKWITEGKVPKG